MLLPRTMKLISTSFQFAAHVSSQMWHNTLEGKRYLPCSAYISSLASVTAIDSEEKIL